MAPRRLLALAGALALASLPLAAPASADDAPAAGERILDYTVGMQLQRDGSMRVDERIEYDFGRPDEERHGIIRYIPTTVGYDDERDRVYRLDDLEVTSPTGAPTEDEESSEDGNTVLRIGDADEAVQGRQTYVLRYTLTGVVNGFSDHEELYWNPVGTGWQVPIAAATATVAGPAPVGEVACFRGNRGSTDTCRGAVAGGRATFTTSALAPGQGMTVVTAFPVGTFSSTAPVLEERQTFARAFTADPVTVGGGAALFALVGGGALAMARRHGRDERYLGVTPGLEPGAGQEAAVARGGGREPVAVQFHPPKDARPGQLGVLIDEKADTVDVTATIVDLAVRGLVRIVETEEPKRFRSSGDWRLERVREPAAGELRDYETKLYGALFDDREAVQLSALKQTFRSDLTSVQNLLYEDVTRAGWFRGNPSSVRTRWTVLGILLLAVGVLATIALAVTTRFGLVGVGLALGGLIAAIAAPRMPARTARGTAVLVQARGFRQYLETAEGDRIRFEEGEDVFSRYLPYAIVFGVAERWAKVFADLAAGGARVAEPDWYVGSSWGPAFNYYALAGAMDSFTTTTSGAIAAAAPSASSSGSSGFGGGGFSGGGGGGGGGGSW